HRELRGTAGGDFGALRLSLAAAPAGRRCRRVMNADTALANPHVDSFSDRQQRREASDLGMWVFLTTETLFFGVLFAGYVIMRVRFPQAFAAAGRHTDLALGTAN